METETLSNYQQPQERHVLDDVNINIPNHDDNSNSLHESEINERSSDFFTEPVVPLPVVCSSDKSGNEEDNDGIVSGKGSDNKLDIEDAEESVIKNSTNTFSESITNSDVVNINHNGETDNKCFMNDQDNPEVSSADYKDKHDSLLEEVCDDDEDPLAEEENTLDNEDPLAEEVSTLDNEEKSVSDNSSQSSKDEELVNTTINDGENKCDNPSESDEKETVFQNNISSVDKEKANSADLKQNDENDKENTETAVIDTDLPNENKNLEESDEVQNSSLLKETLINSGNQDVVEEKDTGENENAVEEMDIDDDFDPSLLCPDIAMEVDEAPVITASDNVPEDGNKSPQLYEPVYSTYVDEMTGAEVIFDLSPAEHQMRQEIYGETNPVQFTKIHCTACNVHLGSALDGQGNRFVHPLLKVLICKNCYHFYTSGEFERDEDGSELYCRWCGQGGQVMCCSSCEMVFCKKCIRINFGRKKLIEIRDSDDWFCFRCNPSQLTELRLHCAEFMEYVRRETSRAATLENATSFMTTDYTQCCLPQKKKSVEPNASEPKKRRRKHLDPDYDPAMDKPSSPTLEIQSHTVPIQPKPKINDNAQKTQIIQGAVFRVGNTTFRPRGIPTSQVRPIRPLSVIQGAVGTVLRPQPSTPGFIKIMPSGIRATSSPRQPAQTFVSTAVRTQSFQQRPIRMAGSTNNTPVKHEWFEKTVRAAARVNSNLSYTLTQLNRAQATASSVEALAVVHNKLQEILSTSINSLIQIRKNLRAEFISGIKNIRTPAKPTPPPRPMPSTSAQDDDVIFVSPTTSPVPTPIAGDTISNLPPSVTLTNTANTAKRNTVPIVPTTTLQLIPSTTTISNGDKPKSFLRVKSLSALQSVPSECITIPDDPVASPPSISEVSVTSSDNVIALDNDDKTEDKEETTKESAEDPAPEKSVEGPAPEKSVENSVESSEENQKDEEEDVSGNSGEKPVVDADNEKSDSQSDKVEDVSDSHSDKVIDISDSRSDKIIDISDSQSDKVEDISFTDDSKDRPPLSPRKNEPELRVHLVRSKEINLLIEKQSELDEETVE